MSTRRRVAALVAFVLVGSGGFAAAQALSPRGTPEQPAPVARVSRFYLAGPSAEYGSDYGGIGEVRPLRLQAVGTGHETVVTASFTYRTRGEGPFVMNAWLEGAPGTDIRVRPGEVALAPSPLRTTTTVRFLAPDLEDGQTYRVHLGVNSQMADHGRNVVRTSKVLLTVEPS